MSSGLMTVDVETRELLQAMDRLGDLAEDYAKAAGMETATRIASEAEARVARREGVTASNIVATDELPSWLGGGKGGPTSAYVYVKAVRRPANLPLWLETGTRYMGAQPFLFVSARLEEGPHLRRLADAMQRAIDGARLGGLT